MGPVSAGIPEKFADTCSSLRLAVLQEQRNKLKKVAQEFFFILHLVLFSLLLALSFLFILFGFHFFSRKMIGQCMEDVPERSRVGIAMGQSVLREIYLRRCKIFLLSKKRKNRVKQVLP